MLLERGFVDWNQDGDFADAGESSTPATCPAGGSVNLTWTAPTMLAGTTYLRLRIADSTQLLAETVNDGGATWSTGDMATAWFRPEDAWVVAKE